MNRYKAARETLISNGNAGLGSARALALLTDEVLSRLVAASSDRPPGRWALLALGGYGAGTLLPNSDVDLLVLSEAPAALLKPFVECLLYPLWDAGLVVGHQVRSPKEHRAAARRDITVLTATLTGRVLAGDTGLGQALIDDCCSDAHGRSRKVLHQLADRERPGSPYLLEPDLKNGAGGRRDYDELIWTATVLTGHQQMTPWPLVEAELLSEAELGVAEVASAVVTAARWDLAVANRSTRLTLDAADRLHPDAGSVQKALADTAHVLDLVRGRVARQSSGTRRETHASTAPVDLGLTGEEVFELLRQGAGSVGPLEHAAWLGRLDALIPGFKALMVLRRPALTHEFTVGAHSIRCAAQCAELCTDAPTERSTALSSSTTALEDDRPLLVAALTHDLGKCDEGPGHAERGRDAARQSARRFGLDAAQQEDVGDLVRHHLLLSETARHEDLDAEDVILSVAGRIGRRALVPALHLLAVADALATGRAAWGPWQDALISTLVSRVDAALSPGVDAAGLAARGETTRAATLSAMPPETPSSALSFIKHAPLRYLASREPDQIATHARLVGELNSSTAPPPARLAVRPHGTEDAFEVAIAAHDRPDLLARCAGALTLAGLDILGAEAYGAPGHIALDIFAVRSATLATVGNETWQHAERYLYAALADRLELEVRLAERRRHYAAAKARVRTRVRVDTSSGYDTAVLVTAADRVGLLYDIAQAIFSTGLDIRWAKALTTGGVAHDSFHVVGADGQAPTDAGVLGHAAMRIRERA